MAAGAPAGADSATGPTARESPTYALSEDPARSSGDVGLAMPVPPASSTRESSLTGAEAGLSDRGEEAMVSKEARVREELVVRKETEERTETVSDTVRQTEVEIEDERGNRISCTGTTDRT